MSAQRLPSCSHWLGSPVGENALPTLPTRQGHSGEQAPAQGQHFVHIRKARAPGCRGRSACRAEALPSLTHPQIRPPPCVRPGPSVLPPGVCRSCISRPGAPRWIRRVLSLHSTLTSPPGCTGTYGLLMRFPSALRWGSPGALEPSRVLYTGEIEARGERAPLSNAGAYTDLPTSAQVLASALPEIR